CDAAELQARQWQVRWGNRGGGRLLHAPRQPAVFPVPAPDPPRPSIPQHPERPPARPGAPARGVPRPAAPGAGPPRAPGAGGGPGGGGGGGGVGGGGGRWGGGGVGVGEWVPSWGGAVNVNPPLLPYRLVRCGAGGPMTSLERERRGPVRPALVRERFVEHFTARFPFARTAFFSDHPSLGRKARSDALASHP